MKNHPNVFRVEVSLAEDRRSYELLLSAISLNQPDLFASEILDTRNSFLVMGRDAAISFQKMLEKQGFVVMRKDVTGEKR